MTRTEFIQNDCVIRLYNNISNRISRLEWQFNNQIERSRINVELYNEHIQILKSYLSVLFNNSVICNTDYKSVYTKFKQFPSTVESHCILLFGGFIPRREYLDKEVDFLTKLSKSNPQSKSIKLKLEEAENVRQYLLSVKKMLRNKTLKARKYELSTRLRYEMHFRLKQGWFVLFNTLTCDAQNIHRVFEAGSLDWSNYIRSVDRAIGSKVHGSWRNAVFARRNGDEFHTYFAVVERGTEHGRLHIHVLHFMKDLPFGYACPNRGLLVPNKREYASFKCFWSFGFSSPVAVRINLSDAWSKIGWRWPVSIQNGNYTPVKSSHPDAVCSYIGDYITDILEYNNDNNRKVGIQWRTRLSRKLGLLPLEILLKKLSRVSKLRLCQNPIQLSRMKLLRRPIPRHLMRRLIIKELLRNSTKKSMMMKFFINLKLKENIYKQFKSVITEIPQLELPSSGSLPIQNLKQTDVFDYSMLLSVFEKQYFYGFPRELHINPTTMEW